ncbi:MAG TPA: HipA domain-containing protein [Pseudobdellovibrionaceae bacterium]|jgi:serine/threonine-protein kinase HipA|nr:HipA domain-containing protein [Pseudobdellovibrionaceae bacterium]
MKIDRCPSTLRQGYDSYSPAALRKIFSGKSVSHILPFTSPENDETVQAAFLENRKRLSISGVQLKLSLTLEKNKLRLTREGESGRFILKPIPTDLMKVDQVPANEHLTMQLAEQIFDIDTAPNALIFFKDDRPAYITKRIDYKPDGTKRRMEDFATLVGKTRDNAGPDFKYEAATEDLFRILREYVGPYLIEAQKLFRLVLFNYVFSNGDAHLKNFSLLETDGGDFILSPAYDLVCSRIHVKDSDIAFKNGMFSNDFETDSFRANGFYAYDDFMALGTRAGISEATVKKEIQQFIEQEEVVADLTGRSFLVEEVKTIYLAEYRNKIKRLAYSLEGTTK